jgi:hypothetical protein
MTVVDIQTRLEMIRRYQERAAQAQTSAERATNPMERERYLQLHAVWKRLEDSERRHASLEAAVNGTDLGDLAT